MAPPGFTTASVNQANHQLVKDQLVALKARAYAGEHVKCLFATISITNDGVPVEMPITISRADFAPGSDRARFLRLGLPAMLASMHHQVEPAATVAKTIAVVMGALGYLNGSAPARHTSAPSC